MVATFKVKLLEKLQLFIGCEIGQTSEGNYLGQSAYINHLLPNNSCSFFKHVVTPLLPLVNISEKQVSEKCLAPLELRIYRSLIGVLSFLTIRTCPDISFTAGNLARKLHVPCS